MSMAHPQQYLYVVAAIILLFDLSPDKATSTSHRFSKTLKFTLYEHSTLNETLFLIVNGVAGSKLTATTSPFGSLSANRDYLTVSPDPSSKIVGISEGLSITTSFDGLNNMAVQRISLSYKNLKGSISFVGVPASINSSDTPIVGGTGDFLFAQGYVTTTLIKTEGYALIYTAEFHLYWPPYAHAK